MTTRVIPIDRDAPDPAAVEEAAKVIASGGLVAFAAETVYGLGADATSPPAVARIFEAKGRPGFNPLIVHVADIGQARDCVSAWPDRAVRLAGRFWPGPLTLVLPRSTLIPDIVTAGRETVGVRVPGTTVARELIRRSGRPIAAPSANRSTGVSPTEARHVLKDLDGKVDVVLDSGPTEVGLESTVIDLTGYVPRILRPGPIGLVELARAMRESVGGGATIDDPGAPMSPGQMSVHYAPRTPTYRLERDHAGEGCRAISGRWGLLVVGGAFTAPGPAPALTRHLPDPVGAAARLYATLHELDEAGLDALVIVLPEPKQAWHAVRDRLTRASRR